MVGTATQTKKKKGKKKARMAKHRKVTKKTAKTAQTVSKPVRRKRKQKKLSDLVDRDAAGFSKAEAVLAALRTSRYVPTHIMARAMKKSGFGESAYGQGLALLRDHGYVVVWVWEHKSYTLNPTFMETYKWCLSHYRTVMTILRRSASAFGLGNDLAKAVRGEAYKDARKVFIKIHNYMKRIHNTA